MEAAIGPRPMADARVGQQGTLTRVWAKRAARPRAPRDTRYEWAYFFGPRRGVAAYDPATVTSITARSWEQVSV